MEEIACVLCGAEGRPWIDQDSWTLRRCDSCELLFLSPRPDARVVAQLYAEDDAHISAGLHISRSNRTSARRAAEAAVRRIRRHKQGGRLLEIGPGGGATLAAARRAGFTVLAYELNPAQAAHIREQLGVRCATNSDELAELADGGLDVVYHRDVMSHFPDPLATLGEIRALLAPDGVMVVETGNFADCGEDDLLSLSSLQLPDHLFFYGRRSLDATLAAAGFEVVGRQRYGLVWEMAFDRIVRRMRRPGHAAGRGDHTRWREALARARFVLRYRVGALANDPRRPCTVVVAARKAPS